MINKISTRTFESIHRLNTGSVEWKEVVASIRAERDTLASRLINCDEESQKSVYQGMLRWIDSLLKDIDNASTILQKRKEIK